MGPERYLWRTRVPVRKPSWRRITHRKLTLEPLEVRRLLAADTDLRDLLYVGIADSSLSPTNPGLLSIADVASGRLAPWHAPISTRDEQLPGWAFSPDEGFSGLAFSARAG